MTRAPTLPQTVLPSPRSWVGLSGGLLLAAAGTIAVASCNEDETSTPPVVVPERPGEQSCRMAGVRAGDPPRIAFEARAGDAIENLTGIAPSPLGLFAFDASGKVARLAADGTATELGQVGDAGETLLDLAVVHDAAAVGELIAVHRASSGEAIVLRRYRIADPGFAAGELIVSVDTPGSVTAAVAYEGAGIVALALGDPYPEQFHPAADDQGSWLGGVVRLDITPLDAGGTYSIPEDNPDPQGEQGAPEVFAKGLVAPSDCFFHAPRSALFCTDVGPSRQELNWIEPGGHYGWPVFEGGVCQPGHETECELAAYRFPTFDVDRDGEGCGLGIAGVPSGGPLAEILIVGALCTGRVHGTQLGAPPADGEVLGEVAGIRSRELGRLTDMKWLAVAVDGQEALGFSDSSEAYRFVVREDGIPGTFPTALSQTECFPSLVDHQPAPDLFPYDIVSPLWTDGSDKHRFLVLPVGERATVDEAGRLQFPEGTILLKTFAYRTSSQPSFRVETRAMVQHADGFEFHTYRWNDEQTDAVLVERSETMSLSTLDHGTSYSVEHLVPDRKGCQACHGFDRGEAIGPTWSQLSMARSYGGAALSQLDAMILSDRLVSPATIPPVTLVDPADAKADIAARARSYLHGNCAHCHRPGGWVPKTLRMDFRIETMLSEMEVCGVELGLPHPGLGAFRLDPGAADNSAIWLRQNSDDDFRMPPLGVSRTDPTAVVVRDWIDGLNACP